MLEYYNHVIYGTPEKAKEKHAKCRGCEECNAATHNCRFWYAIDQEPEHPGLCVKPGRKGRV